MPKTAQATDPEPLGRLIRRHRKQMGLRQVDLAEIIDEDQRYITAVETGKVTPPIYRLRPFIEALGIPADAVFETPEAHDRSRESRSLLYGLAALLSPTPRAAAVAL